MSLLSEAGRLEVRPRRLRPSAMAHGDSRFDHFHAHAQIDSGTRKRRKKL
jgi:hypothetical protein